MIINTNAAVVIETSWPELKDFAATKMMQIQTAEDDKRLSIFAMDGLILYQATILKTGVEDAETKRSHEEWLADFEQNHRASANQPVAPKNSAGEPIMAPTSYAFSKEHAVFQGFLYQPTPGALSMFDEPITKQIYIQGGTFWCTGAVLGDYAELSVVDKDDVLGMFGALGLVVGQDVLEVYKYVRKAYMKPGTHDGKFEAPTAGLVRQGLYMRCSYNSVGDQAIALCPTYLWYEV